MELLYTIGKLILAIIFSGLIGLEREKLEKSAGLRTMMLISLSSALLTVISLRMPEFSNSLHVRFDIGRIIAYMVAGVGFLGSGIIMKRNGSKKNVEGLTTASCLWGVLAIGVLCGLGMIDLAAIATILILIILRISWGYKKSYKRRKKKIVKEEKK